MYNFVHLIGLLCGMNNIIHFAKKNNKVVKIFPSSWSKHKKTVATFGDIGVWSFCNDKIISTLGEGGIV